MLVSKTTLAMAVLLCLSWAHIGTTIGAMPDRHRHAADDRPQMALLSRPTLPATSRPRGRLAVARRG
jgi:hypothetical protein